MNKPHLPVFVKEEKKEGIVVAKTRHGASTKACHIYCRYSQQGCHIFPFLTQLEKIDCCGCKFAQQHVSAKNIKNMVFTFLTSGCKYTQQSCHIFPFLTELSQG